MAVNCFHPINYHGNELVLISQNEHLFFVWFQCQVHPIVEERSWSDTPLAILIKRCFRLFQIVVTSTNSISLHQNIGLNILDRDDKLSNFSNPRRFNLYSDIQCLMVCSSDKGLVVQRILLLDIDLGQLEFSLSLRRGYFWALESSRNMETAFVTFEVVQSVFFITENNLPFSKSIQSTYFKSSPWKFFNMKSWKIV